MEALFNANMTMNKYYQAEVNYDLYGEIREEIQLPDNLAGSCIVV